MLSAVLTSSSTSTSINPLGFFSFLSNGTQDGVNAAIQYPDWMVSLGDTLGHIWEVYTIIAFIISAIFIYGIIYAYLRNNQFASMMLEGVTREEQLYQELYRGNKKNSRWDDIEMHLQSDNPNDWKLAIIEADVMLEDVLREAGYAGATIGDKLKSASPTSFTSLDDAWRAHRVRNQIAHEGPDFILTRKVANETIVMYRKVFQEFGAL